MSNLSLLDTANSRDVFPFLCLFCCEGGCTQAPTPQGRSPGKLGLLISRGKYSAAPGPSRHRTQEDRGALTCGVRHNVEDGDYLRGRAPPLRTSDRNLNHDVRTDRAPHSNPAKRSHSKISHSKMQRTAKGCPTDRSRSERPTYAEPNLRTGK